MYIRLRYFILVALVLAAHWLMTDTTEAQAQPQYREPQTLTEIVNEVDAKWGEPGFDYTRGDTEIPDVSVCESLR
ncbi:TPA: hypothetical protein WH375_001214 [Neisseria meningitidis]|uniref:hypothetical protein n=1 Tax=Neisseria meningitidis TaxID=487 RepID=UPI000268709F|nr:hypothetical protein [Neisseria meningitidis]MCG3359312.1 hypothetical protein [Neisseria meningitidis]CCI73061.1 hypothetical protein BN21_1026 [Neisseria meningitidis alpha704]